MDVDLSIVLRFCVINLRVYQKGTNLLSIINVNNRTISSTIFSFAYVEFTDKDSVQIALAMDDSLFKGRQIKVIYRLFYCFFIASFTMNDFLFRFLQSVLIVLAFQAPIDHHVVHRLGIDEVDFRELVLATCLTVLYHIEVDQAEPCFGKKILIVSS